jgi:hypothetical protein
MSATHDTYADEPVDWKAERAGFIAVIKHYVPYADMCIVNKWPTYFLQRMGTAGAEWWDADDRWGNIMHNAKREGLRCE